MLPGGWPVALGLVECDADPDDLQRGVHIAGLPYANPHSFRKTLAQLGERMCRTPEEFKAWSQNLGHEQVLTTFSSYGQVAHERQAELIRGLGGPADDQPAQWKGYRPGCAPSGKRKTPVKLTGKTCRHDHAGSATSASLEIRPCGGRTACLV